MSSFSVAVTRIRAVFPHPNAERLELAQIGDYRCCVQKGLYKEGDLCVYIPEAAVLPEAVLLATNMKGSTLLAGKDHNRVKALKLRGELSQGLTYPVQPEWVEGQDVAEILGITKFIPPIPQNLAGEVWNAGLNRCFHYDIENAKKFPDILVDGEEVVFTEKIHGTFSVFAVMPPADADSVEGDFLIGSKGLFAQGLAFKLSSPANAQNLYVRVARQFQLRKLIQAVYESALKEGHIVYVMGESFGVQDLKYGASTTADDSLGFRVFDIRIGRNGRFLNDKELDEDCAVMGLKRCTVLYRGPFSKTAMLEHTRGTETVSGKGLHIREGLVACPVTERYNPSFGRVKLKSVSEDYLLRKGKGDEPTEFE